MREFTSFDVAVVVRELKQGILGSRVNNIYQLDGKTMLFKLHKPDKPPIDLIIEAGNRLHLTSYILEKPSVPPPFCMALRKHLRNARLTSLNQYEFERVITAGFKTNEGILRLIVELFGDGNIILADENNKILQALSYKQMRDRSILRREVFRFAPPSGKNPSKVTKGELIEELKLSGQVEVVRVLARRLSIGGTYAEEVLLRAKVDKSKHCNMLNQNEIDAIFEGLQTLVALAIEGILEPAIVLNNDGTFVDVVPFKLRRYENIGFKLQPRCGFNEALDEFYTKVASIERALAGLKVDQLKREAERLKRILADQQCALKEAEADAITNRSVGETIYAHSSEMQTLVDRFSANKQKGKKWDEIVSEVLAERKTGATPNVLFESFESRTHMIHVRVDDLRFGLNLRKSLFQNAAEYYEKSKRARQKLEGAKAALEETGRKLQNVEAKMIQAEALGHVRPTEAMEELARRKLRHKDWFEKFRWFVSSDEFLVVAGKDAVSNDVLIKKHTEPEDIVFHAEVIGAPFVVIKTQGKQPTEQVLTEAAEFAAAFSRGWREGFASMDVYWVKPDQLKKSGPSGQYVTRGAFAVDGKRNWRRNVPLRVAVGVVTERDEAVSLIGGTIGSVKAKTQIYTVVMPGDFAGKGLFEYILKTLTAKMPRDQRQSVQNTSVEEIRGFIPYGIGKVLENQTQND